MNIQQKKNVSGITLIALVITIIVLLILAGVTISAISGNENTMGKANQAKQDNDLANELEQIKLCVVNAVSQGLDGKVSAENLQNMLNGIVAQTEIDKITGNGPWIIKGNSGREYKITNGGGVNPIDTMDKAIVSAITVEERATVPIVISNGDNIEEIKSCTISDTSIATVAKDTDNVWKITGGTLTGNVEESTTTLTIEGNSGKKIENISVIVKKGKPLAVNTLLVNPSATTAAQKSPYVYYYAKDGNENNKILCRVLYNDNSHGLQIISNNSTMDIILGNSDPLYNTGADWQKARDSYNNAITSLNNYAQSYIKENDNIVQDARCVGSVSITSNSSFGNKNDEELLTNPNNYSNIQSFVNNNFKGTDTHYGTDEGTDFQQMEILNITNIDDSYWLASRNTTTSAKEIHCYIRAINSAGSLDNTSNELYKWTNGAGTTWFSHTNKLRPVFLINPTAKIKSGTGTQGDPYILEAGN